MKLTHSMIEGEIPTLNSLQANLVAYSGVKLVPLEYVTQLRAMYLDVCKQRDGLKAALSFAPEITPAMQTALEAESAPDAPSSAPNETAPAYTPECWCAVRKISGERLQQPGCPTHDPEW